MYSLIVNLLVGALGTTLIANFLYWITAAASLLLNTVIIFPIARDICTLIFLVGSINFSEILNIAGRIIKNFQVLVGIVMLFVVAFNLLKMLVNPDSKGANSGREIFQSVIVTVVLLVSSPFIFGILHDFQKAIIADNLISKLFIGPENSPSSDGNTTAFKAAESMSTRVTYSLFFLLYQNNFSSIDHLIDFTFNTDTKELVKEGKTSLATAVIPNFVDSTIGAGGVISHIKDNKVFIWEKITYIPIFTGIVGIVLITMFGSFVIDIAMRGFALVILEVIFPMMAIAYILPGKGRQLFTKYVSYYMTTYVSYFAKLVMIYLILYVSDTIVTALNTDNGLFADLGLKGHPIVATLLAIFLLVGLFAFYKRGIPALAKSIFGVDIGKGKSFVGKALGFVGGAVALVAGAVTGGVAAAGAGAAKAAVAKAALTSGVKAASIGSSVGKKLGSGEFVAGIKEGITGGMNMHKQNKSIRENGNKEVINKAKSDQDKYNKLNASLNKEQKILNQMRQNNPNNPNNPNILNQQRKVGALQQQVAAARTTAIASAVAAAKIDSNYVPDAVTNAEKAEREYHSLEAAEQEARRKEQQLATNDPSNPNRGLINAEIQELSKKKQDAYTDAVNAAREAQAWDSNYNSALLVGNNAGGNNAGGNNAGGNNAGGNNAGGNNAGGNNAGGNNAGGNNAGGQNTGGNNAGGNNAGGNNAGGNNAGGNNAGGNNIGGNNAGGNNAGGNNAGGNNAGGNNAGGNNAGGNNAGGNNAGGNNAGGNNAGGQPVIDIGNDRPEIGGNPGMDEEIVEQNAGELRDAVDGQTESLEESEENAETEESNSPRETGSGQSRLDVQNNSETSTQLIEKINNDHRGYGERASERASELMQNNGMPADRATIQAVREAAEAIYARAMLYIKSGRTVDEAYELARNDYFERR